MTDLVLKAEPDWAAAAQALIDGLNGQSTPDARVTVLQRVCDGLGEALYPGFVKLLAAVARFGDEEARRLTADALARALTTDRLPATRLPAWGAAAFSGLSGPGGGLMTNARSVGPLEFLCVWLTRDVVGQPLEDEAFERAAALVLTLIQTSPEAARLYAGKLAADADSPTEGLHNRQSRRLVRLTAEGLAAGRAPAETARAVLDAARADRDQGRWDFTPR